MKRKLAIVILTVFITMIAILLINFINVYKKKQSISLNTTSLPSFFVEDVYGNKFTEKELPSKNWTVFVFFNSECHYCQSEAEQLRDLKSSIDDISFLWISSEEQSKLKEFQKTYNLEHITFLHDNQDELATLLGVSSIPYFLIYTPTDSLFRKHKGALRIDKLISQIHDKKN